MVSQIRVCSHLLLTGLHPSHLSLSDHLLICQVALTQRAAVRVTGLCCVDPETPSVPRRLSLPIRGLFAGSSDVAKVRDDFFMFSVLPAPDSPLQVQSRSRQVKSREGSGCREAKQCKVQAGCLHILAIQADRVGPEGTWALKPLTPTQLSRCSLTLLGPLVCSLQISIQSPPN